MIKILYLISLTLLISSCSEKVVEEKEKIDLSINFNTSSTVIFHYKNAQDSVFLETSFYNSFPSDYIETKTLLAQKKGLKELTFKIQHPQKVELYYGDLTVQCFLIPNDTLDIFINLDTNQHIKKSMNYVGKYAAINNFYKNKELFFNKTAYEMNLSKALAFNAINTLSEYSSIVDSLSQIELNFMNDYINKSLLPQWFIDYELAEIKCATAGSKLIIVSYRKRFLKQEVNIPENYYSEIDSLMKDFKASIISSNYHIYLARKVHHQLRQLPDSVQRSKNYKKLLVNAVTKNLSPEAADIYLSQYLERVISSGRINDTTYQLYYNAIQNQEFKTYLEEKKEKGDFLKLGEKAPSFMLPDINGKEIQLKDFKGNIVYLNFWFAGCAPCRAEFPNENKLVEKFKGKKVKIINICTITPKDNWKLVSEKFNLKMINLHADEVLTPFIEKNYGITGYPHHVLIDEEGKIIKNKCARAKNIEKEIDLLLKELN